ncbi:MAG: hypothetical protein AAB656_00620, partial [Patescibacteria group bacterium]
IDKDGTRSRQYNTLRGKWPVYIADNEEQITNRYLQGGGIDGKVVYVAEIDLEKDLLGTNVSWEYQYPQQEGPLGYPQTVLRVVEDKNGFYLVTETDKNLLQPGLGSRFDDGGKLMIDDNFGGEFYLNNYGGHPTLENEHIYRFKEGKPVEITREVETIREAGELRMGDNEGLSNS